MRQIHCFFLLLKYVLLDESKIPCVFTSITPAWNNINLRRLSDKIKSRFNNRSNRTYFFLLTFNLISILYSTIFAHVRAASPGLVTSQTNCHPFQYNQVGVFFVYYVLKSIY